MRELVTQSRESEAEAMLARWGVAPAWVPGEARTGPSWERTMPRVALRVSTTSRLRLTRSCQSMLSWSVTISAAS